MSVAWRHVPLLSVISFIGGVLVALLRLGLVSRLMLLVLRPMGPTFARLRIANTVAYAVNVAVCTYGVPFSGPHKLLAQIGLNLVPALIWLVFDTLALMRRRARIRDAVYISRMR